MNKVVTSFLLAILFLFPTIANAEDTFDMGEITRNLPLTEMEVAQIKDLTEDELVQNYEKGLYPYSFLQRLIIEGYLSEEKANEINFREKVDIKNSDLKDYGLTIDNTTGKLTSIPFNKNAISPMTYATTYPGSSVNVRIGDILVTSSTILGEYIGHAGIVISENRVAHLPGKSNQRDPNVAIEPKGINEWFTTYPKTTVLRVKELSAAQKSGNWASNHMYNYGHKVEYAIPSKLEVFATNYCSKFVYQSHIFGNTNIFKSYSGWHIFTPYDILDLDSYVRTEQPLIVYSKNGPKGDIPSK